MKAYSMDLRERVVAAVDEGKQTKWEIALRFQVSTAWIRRLLQRRRETGSIAPTQRDYRVPHQVDDALRHRLAELVRQTPDATLDELRQAAGATVSRSTVARVLAALGLTLKKSRSTPASRTAPTCRRSAPSSAGCSNCSTPDGSSSSTRPRPTRR
jgi:transposase